MDDTELDALAAQVRLHPALPEGRVAVLLREAPGQPAGPAADELVRHHLGIVLDSALAHVDAHNDVTDLFQEGSIALVAAIAAYATDGGAPAGLRAHLRAAVDGHLDAVVAAAAERRAADEAFVRDSRLLEGVEVELRRRLSRHPTTAELARSLGWTEDRVVVMERMLAEARELHDESLLPYLEDAHDVEDGDSA